MKAIICTEYGPPEVPRLAEVEKPVPQDNQVLIRIHATTATTAEVMERKGESVIGRIILGFRKPRKRFRILGWNWPVKLNQLAGLSSDSSKAIKFMDSPGLDWAPMPNARVCLKRIAGSQPANLTYEEAAAVVDGASTALYSLRDKGRIQRGQKVLIIGASAVSVLLRYS